MTYTIHEKDDRDGWKIVKSSDSIEDFPHPEDQWSFNHILKEGGEYVKMGYTMWTIEWDQNNKGKN